MRRGRGLVAALSFALVHGVAGPALPAGPAAARLADAVTELERAAESGGDAARAAALVAAISAYEEALGELRAGLRTAVLQEADITRRLDAESARVAQVLGVLTAVERGEGPLLLLHPAGPLGTVRSGILAAELAPALQAEAAALRLDLAALSTIREERAAALALLERGLAQVQAARAALAQAAADRRPLPAPLAADAAAVAELARGVRSFEALAAGLAARPAPGVSSDTTSAGGGFAEARGRLPWPVRGRVVRRAGEADAAGVRRPGVILAAAPAALVTAPWPATVRYAGPLLGDAIVMVLEPEPGYLLIVAGLAIGYVRAGDVVEAGAALGLLTGSDPGVGEFVAAVREPGVGMQETLYVEMRHGNVAVNPTEWFTGAQD